MNTNTQIKVRLKSKKFLQVTYKGTKVLAWFPSYFMIDLDYKQTLSNKNKSLVIVEGEDGTTKGYEVDKSIYSDIWLNNKSCGLCRHILVEQSVKFIESTKN